MFPAEQSGWERSPTHGPGADSQRIADGDMVRPAGHQAEDTGSPAETTRHAALVFLLSETGLLGGSLQKGSSLRRAERAKGPLKPGADNCPLARAHTRRAPCSYNTARGGVTRMGRDGGTLARVRRVGLGPGPVRDRPRRMAAMRRKRSLQSCELWSPLTTCTALSGHSTITDAERRRFRSGRSFYRTAWSRPLLASMRTNLPVVGAMTHFCDLGLLPVVSCGRQTRGPASQPVRPQPPDSTKLVDQLGPRLSLGRRRMRMFESVSCTNMFDAPF